MKALGFGVSFGEDLCDAPFVSKGFGVAELTWPWPVRGFGAGGEVGPIVSEFSSSAPAIINQTASGVSE